MTIVYCLIGLAFGLLIAFVNSRISKKVMFSPKASPVFIGSFLRILLDIAALALAFFVSKACNLPAVPILIAVAIGLSVGGAGFLILMTSRAKLQMPVGLKTEKGAADADKGGD